MADGKDGDGKGTYVNIQTNTDSIANADSIFEKMIINQKKSRDCYRGPIFPCKETKYILC